LESFACESRITFINRGTGKGVGDVDVIFYCGPTGNCAAQDTDAGTGWRHDRGFESAVHEGNCGSRHTGGAVGITDEFDFKPVTESISVRIGIARERRAETVADVVVVGAGHFGTVIQPVVVAIGIQRVGEFDEFICIAQTVVVEIGGCREVVRTRDVAEIGDAVAWVRVDDGLLVVIRQAVSIGIRFDDDSGEVIEMSVSC